MAKEMDLSFRSPSRFRLSGNFEASRDGDYVMLYGADHAYLFLDASLLADLIALLKAIAPEGDLPTSSPGGFFARLESERDERVLLAALRYHAGAPSFCLERWEAPALLSGLRALSALIAESHRWHATGFLGRRLEEAAETANLGERTLWLAA